MRVKVCRQMNQIGEDVRRVREEQQPCPRQAQETPVSSRRAAVLLTGQQREDHRQPRQEQVPDEERVADVAGPHDARKDQQPAGGGRKSQSEHWHSRFPLKSEFQESHSNLRWTIYHSAALNVSGRPCAIHISLVWLLVRFEICWYAWKTGTAINISARPNNGQLNCAGSTLRKASTSWLATRIVSAMNA